MTHFLAKAIAATLLALLATLSAQADWPLYRGTPLAQGVADEAWQTISN